MTQSLTILKSRLGTGYERWAVSARETCRSMVESRPRQEIEKFNAATRAVVEALQLQLDRERAEAEKFRCESHVKMDKLQTTVDGLTNNVQTLTVAVNTVIQGLNQQQVGRTGAQAPPVPAVPTAVGAEDGRIGEFFISFVFFCCN